MNNSKNTLHAFTSVAMSLHRAGDHCVYCDKKMERLRLIDYPKRTDFFYDGDSWKQQICPSCRWWTLEYDGFLSHEDGNANRYGNAIAVFQDFPVQSIETPIHELRQYLLNQYDARFDIHPRKLEEILKSVFRDYGFYVELTSYTGIYVTTSSYTRGALEIASAESLKNSGYFLDLWDSRKLLDALRSGVVRDSADVAWEMRHSMPIIREPIGDYGPPFPRRTPPDSEIRWWSSEVASRCHSNK